MTTEQLRQNAAAMLACADGKPIQCRCDSINRDPEEGWSTIMVSDQSPQWAFRTHEYRPKPEPVTVPWTIEEIDELVGTIVRFKRGKKAYLMVLQTNGHKVWVGANDSMTPDEFCDQFVSADGKEFTKVTQ